MLQVSGAWCDRVQDLIVCRLDKSIRKKLSLICGPVFGSTEAFASCVSFTQCHWVGADAVPDIWKGNWQ